MKRILVLLVLFYFSSSVVFAVDNSYDMAPNLNEKITKEFRPMPPIPGPNPYPYPNPGPNNDRELCLAEGYYYNNFSRVFYAFGERRQMAIRKALQKCQNAGFFNCRVGWCGEVY